MHTWNEPTTCRNGCAQLAARQAVRTLLAVLLLWAPAAGAQNNLGQLLDAGGKLLSLEEFRQQVVQRVMVGPTSSGGNIELMYTGSGTIQGIGTVPGATKGPLMASSPYQGEWTAGENETVCATMNVRAAGGGVAVTLPRRCQFWFRLGEKYYLSDFDTDRSAKVLVRTIKP
jgi:hypothetical protein